MLCTFSSYPVLIFLSLIISTKCFFFSPELFCYEDLLKNPSDKNLTHAFNMADEKLGIEKILDPEGNDDALN